MAGVITTSTTTSRRRKTASVRPKGECAYCHMASAKKDDVWTQFYPMLDDIAKKFGG